MAALWPSPGSTSGSNRQPLKQVISSGIGELESSIAKDLSDSKDPKHTLFFREKTHLSVFTRFLRDNIFILSNRFATAAESLEHIFD